MTPADLVREAGDALARARDAAGLTQEQLAQKAGVGVATVSAIERGVVDNTSLRVLHVLARALGGRLTCRIDFQAGVTRLVRLDDAIVYGSVHDLLRDGLDGDSETDCVICGRVAADVDDWATLGPVIIDNTGGAWRLVTQSRTGVDADGFATVSIRLRALA